MLFMEMLLALWDLVERNISLFKLKKVVSPILKWFMLDLGNSMDLEYKAKGLILTTTSNS
jgi:hypothetical protein